MVYKWYILPTGGLYVTYHPLKEPEKSIEMMVQKSHPKPRHRIGPFFQGNRPLLGPIRGSLGYMLNIYQWLFLVPLKGGRWHIIPQLAVYTTYIPLIYCLLGGYMLPTTF